MGFIMNREQNKAMVIKCSIKNMNSILLLLRRCLVISYNAFSTNEDFPIPLYPATKNEPVLSLFVIQFLSLYKISSLPIKAS